MEIFCPPSIAQLVEHSTVIVSSFVFPPPPRVGGKGAIVIEMSPVRLRFEGDLEVVFWVKWDVFSFSFSFCFCFCFCFCFFGCAGNRPGSVQAGLRMLLSTSMMMCATCRCHHTHFAPNRVKTSLLAPLKRQVSYVTPRNGNDLRGSEIQGGVRG